MANSSEINGICLKVFARISAGISHEIKNTLAIINESAGLLDDLVSLVGGGENPISAERVQTSVSTIIKQVNRSNAIMKHLNRFAHSRDVSPSSAPLAEVVALVIALSARQAAMKRVMVVTDCPANPVVETDLLCLEALLYLTLCRMYGLMASGSTLTVKLEEHPAKLVIHLLPDALDTIPPDTYPDTEEKTLADYLGGSCEQGQNTLSIIIPAGTLTEQAS